MQSIKIILSLFSDSQIPDAKLKHKIFPTFLVFFSAHAFINVQSYELRAKIKLSRSHHGSHSLPHIVASLIGIFLLKRSLSVNVCSLLEIFSPSQPKHMHSRARKACDVSSNRSNLISKSYVHTLNIHVE